MAQLRGIGVGKLARQELRESGLVTQLRRGWWAAPNANSEVVAAVSAGGVLTGPSALKLYGAWVPRHLGVHARVTDRRMCRAGATHHILEGALSTPCARSCDDVRAALLVTMRDFPVEIATVVTDSIADRKLMTLSELQDVSKEAGARGEAVLKLFDPKAGSGIETIFRLWLRRNGIQFQTQVHVPGVGRVDFLIGDRLIVEVDGFEYHASAEQFQSDRRRDRALTERGYLVIRLTYEDVVTRLDEVGQGLLNLVRQDAHRRRGWKVAG